MPAPIFNNNVKKTGHISLYSENGEISQENKALKILKEMVLCKLNAIVVYDYNSTWDFWKLGHK